MNVLWTLSYEMAFYLLIVALFVVGGHRRSAPAAVVLTVVALVAVTLTATGLLTGAYAPAALLSRTAGTGPVVGVTVAALLVAIAAAVSRRRAAQIAGGFLRRPPRPRPGLGERPRHRLGEPHHARHDVRLHRRPPRRTRPDHLAGRRPGGRRRPHGRPRRWRLARRPYGWNAQLVWCGAVLSGRPDLHGGLAPARPPLRLGHRPRHHQLLPLPPAPAAADGRRPVPQHVRPRGHPGPGPLPPGPDSRQLGRPTLDRSPAQRLGRRLSHPPRPEKAVQPQAVAY